jgi:hypothetical protein
MAGRGGKAGERRWMGREDLNYPATALSHKPEETTMGRQKKSSETKRYSFPRKFRPFRVKKMTYLAILCGCSSWNWSRILDPISSPLQMMEFGPEFQNSKFIAQF